MSLCVCCAFWPTPFDATRRLGCVTSTRTGASFCLSSDSVSEGGDCFHRGLHVEKAELAGGGA